ncbi:carboxymuconolactone decarboxylase family protein [Lysobacter sp. CFH 32150]|uniref:carboxymuconolactone decarboxylase family protein n=1 Tax=Lysobacter sp. CFH 32150 TaxID=2927128 RepID=UPI001FA6FA3A|nr:carboxymuconolactone decarboxylase family protein [Lysobacter sp. CFH 32150]MCI4567862.1 carboxymuconolactone decarboxylase family protein [Lysobacter sp. CFH 32150]
MSLSDLRNALPDYAKDLKLNLDSVLSDAGSPGLDGKQVRVIAVASAIASRYTPLVAAIEAFAAEQLSPEEIAGAKAAAAIMAMNNIYYRATHLIHNDEYGQLRAGLRMNVMANPGIDKITFELASLAVSAINGCGACMDSHERTIRQHEVSAQGVQSALKIGAVVHAVAVTLEQSAA